ncbi:hypothetical protein KP509_07G088600 [Ceratopteris richardii]|uniref:Uncharacterized protein n=1 Tax=Ceratopteris richardii TaxID=49495 RepID=A0A8T2UC39_CERRI|nr:hypothetical protein KP509_07G088600 [Ceratopteris richardii]
MMVEEVVRAVEAAAVGVAVVVDSSVGLTATSVVQHIVGCHKLSRVDET